MTASAEIVQERATVPFFDPGPSFAVLKSTFVAEISELIDSGAFINGPQAAAFESAFAEYCGAEHCVGVAKKQLADWLMANSAELGKLTFTPAQDAAGKKASDEMDACVTRIEQQSVAP